MMVGIELVKNRKTKEPAVKEREQILQESFREGLLLLGCGESGVRFCPPLIVTNREIDTAMEILSGVFKKVRR